MVLQRNRPRIANRSCRDCLRWMHDDMIDGDGNKTGNELPVLDQFGDPRPRRGKVPCETQQGCPKGHWNTWKAPREGDLRLLSAYRMVRLAGIDSLSDRERADDLFMQSLAMIDEQIRYMESQEQIQGISHGAATAAMVSRAAPPAPQGGGRGRGR